MIEEVAPNLYRIAIPLPIPAMVAMNAYVIVDPQRHLIIDPGMAHDMCHTAMTAALVELRIDLKQSDFFVTHHHMDHFGLTSRIAADGSCVYINPMEADDLRRISSGGALTDMVQLLDAMGFPERDPMKVIPEMFGDEYRTGAALRFRYVTEGDTIKKGGFCFRCVVTPGHTRAHTCLYEPDRKILISGDQISPVIQYATARGNPLDDHLKSMQRLLNLEIDLVLPGHLSTYKDSRKKIDRIVAHHMGKLKAFEALLGKVDGDAYHIAEKMWRQSGNAEGWETLTTIQRYFFTRDCCTYMRYIAKLNRPSFSVAPTNNRLDRLA